jgi:hypothetical protein
MQRHLLPTTGQQAAAIDFVEEALEMAVYASD